MFIVRVCLSFSGFKKRAAQGLYFSAKCGKSVGRNQIAPQLFCNSWQIKGFLKRLAGSTVDYYKSGI
jgi:hypothetical protein